MMGLGLSMGSCVVLPGSLIDSLQRRRKTKNYIGTSREEGECGVPVWVPASVLSTMEFLLWRCKGLRRVRVLGLSFAIFRV